MLGGKGNRVLRPQQSWISTADLAPPFEQVNLRRSDLYRLVIQQKQHGFPLAVLPMSAICS